MECGGAEDAEGLHFVSMPGEDFLELATGSGEAGGDDGFKEEGVCG